MHSVGELVNKLEMQNHPEGGWYKETYRAAESIDKAALPSRFSGNRAFSTAIYFLLPAGVFSAFHRIQSDECWHFYEGLPLFIHVIHPNGKLELIKLGRDLKNGESFQAVVPAGSWFASVPAGDEGHSLTGCTVAPGFDFADFEMAEAEKLAAQFPPHEILIRALCRG